MPDRKIMFQLDSSMCVCTTMFRITPAHLLWALVENLCSGQSSEPKRFRWMNVPRHFAKIALDRMFVFALMFGAVGRAGWSMHG